MSPHAHADPRRMRLRSLWFTTYIWGVLYLRNQSPPYFDAAHIRLFTISYVDA